LSKVKKAAFRTVEDVSEWKKACVHVDGQGFLDIESAEGQYRYKVGLIDFLTKFSGFKQFENKFKSTMHRVDAIEISAIDQDRYQRRFMSYLREHL